MNFISDLISVFLVCSVPESTATAKGHMNRNQKHTRSTTKLREKPSRPPDAEEDMRPEKVEDVKCELFVGATIAEQNEGTLHTDQTVAFPVVSFKGNKIMFVAYEYRSNAILVRPIKDNSNNSLVQAFQCVYEYLTSKGFKPKLNILDNQCSKKSKNTSDPKRLTSD
jgi:hypothetical protein